MCACVRARAFVPGVHTHVSRAVLSLRLVSSLQAQQSAARQVCHVGVGHDCCLRNDDTEASQKSRCAQGRHASATGIAWGSGLRQHSPRRNQCAAQLPSACPARRRNRGAKASRPHALPCARDPRKRQRTGTRAAASQGCLQPARASRASRASVTCSWRAA